ncbi:diguanylate cyclase [Shewanella mangrovi]|uniref:Diguanylate cyclase n=1 Tax=Shewanella mangrovi TaxID=1515746 RepID=A0A094LRY5_9GAMM|nr:EAL domain-containing protein [Shewanella mangrovi]KFZ37948.1 diguanylate cyclase [Shewanella mangrovi]
MPNRTFWLLLILQLSISVAAFSAPSRASDDTPSVTSDTKAESVEDSDDNFSPPVLLNVDTYGVSEGLSQSTVTSVAEDDDGYIWIGTLNGLNRFDGKEFKQFYANDGSGLDSSFIRNIFFSKYYKRIYIKTDESIFYFDKKIEKFINTALDPKSISLSEYQKISSDSYTFNRNIENDHEINIDNFKTSIFFKNVLYTLDSDGNLYRNGEDIIRTNIIDIVSTTNDLVALSKDKIEFIEQKQIIKTNMDAIYVKNGTLYSIKKSDIYKIKNDEVIKIGRINSKNFYISKNHYIKTIRSGVILSNLNEGFLYMGKTKNLLKTIEKFQSPVWSISKTLDLKNNSFNFVIADNSTNIKVFDEKFRENLDVNCNIAGAKSATIYNEHIYLGSLNGVFECTFDGKNRKILDKPATVIKSYNNSLLIGAADGEIYKFDSNSGIQLIYSIPNKNPIFDIYESQKNNEIYIAHQDGMERIELSLDKTTLKNSYTEVSGKIVFCILKDGDIIYIGTNDGVFTLKDGNLSKISRSKKSVFSITKINDIVVASSINEVQLFNNEKTYIINSLMGAQYEYNSQSAANNGKYILLGGSEGLSIFEPKDLIKTITETKKIETNIDSILVFNIPLKPGTVKLPEAASIANEITLKYTDYPFTLKFNSPSSSSFEPEYKYRLAGLSSEWIASNKNQSATYTNLSPGKYEFQVYAVNPINDESGAIKSIGVVITPPWWLSIEAKLIYSLIVSLIVIFLIKAILRKRQIQRQIAQSEERLKLSLWGSGDEMWDWDIETGKIYRSNIWGALEFPMDGQRSGKDGEESNIHPQDQLRVREALDKHFVGETDHFEATYRVRSKNGDWLWILDRAKIVERDDKDQPLRMTGTIKNINSFKTAEEQLRLFERAIENISEGVFILDIDFNFVEVNEAACDITRYTHDEMVGVPLYFAKYSEDYNKQIVLLLKQQGRWNTEIEVIRGDSTEFLMELTIDAIYDEQGVLTHYVGVFSDISHRKKQEAELRRLTNNDLLTGLPNRSNLQVTLENLVKKDSHHTLMMMDLDNFKKINDSLGHQIGDELLKNVATRLRKVVPKHTNLYRLGGDEFAILIDNNPDIGSSAIIANDIIEAFRAPFELSEEILVVGVSIGIVLYPEDEQNEQALLRKADIAMYHAKSAGGNRYQFYSESLNRNALRQLEVESLIREALRDDLFEVYFQPKISLATTKLAGMEALVRLNHPKHGLISPAEFIPLAEETGLIVEIGDVVLKKACFAAQGWREQGLFNGRVAVNLSSRQFALPDLQTRIETILQLTKLPASNLELEITEGTVIKQPEKAIKVMHQLAKLGISLALDDFGTGYSSLSYLKRFPIHTLKIDKAFVDDIDKSDRDLKMVDSIITIAHNMGLSVVGEGVEQTAQLNILRALKCEEIQGFIYSKAISRDDFTSYLERDCLEKNLGNGTE